MFRCMSALLVFLLLAGSPATAHAASSSRQTPVIFDVLLIRPLGFVGFVAGSVLTVAVTPFIVVVPLDGRLGRVYERTVFAPARFVFVDPIGSH